MRGDELTQEHLAQQWGPWRGCRPGTQPSRGCPAPGTPAPTWNEHAAGTRTSQPASTQEALRTCWAPAAPSCSHLALSPFQQGGGPRAGHLGAVYLGSSRHTSLMCRGDTVKWENTPASARNRPRPLAASVPLRSPPPYSPGRLQMPLSDHMAAPSFNDK